MKHSRTHDAEQESVTVPANPFTTERLKSLPGGMTRALVMFQF